MSKTTLPKRQPQRMCVGCRRSQDKNLLIRLVHTGDGRVAIDAHHIYQGRGAYICHNQACWQRALKRKSVEKALRLAYLHEEDQIILLQFAQNLEYKQ